MDIKDVLNSELSKVRPSVSEENEIRKKISGFVSN